MGPTTDLTYCARCHQQGVGCCTLLPGTEALLFGLTRAECECISAATGRPVEAFTVEDTPPPGFREMLLAIHPAFAGTLPQGRRVHLRVQAGHCCFLAESGCSLPVEARPYYCRLYPTWFDADDRPMLPRSGTCLAQQGALTLFEVMRRLGETEPNLRALFQRWLSAARANGADRG